MLLTAVKEICFYLLTMNIACVFVSVCVISVKIIMSVNQTPVDHLLSVQVLEAVSVFLGMKSPQNTNPLQILMVVLVSTFISSEL